MKKIAVLVLSLILFTASASADFLIVQRNGNLRITASTASEILEKVRKGDTLVLVDPIQVSGYYHVISQASQQEGFIYHTLVRRIIGDLQSVPTPIEDAVVDIRVLDVGPGLCTLIKLPGNKFVIYDAGGADALQDGNKTLAQIKEYIPAGSEIALMVLSHTDGDHITAAGKVVGLYHVSKVLWGGYESSMISGGEPSDSYTRLVDSLQTHPSTENVNLNEKDSVITPGNELRIGDATLTFLCGFGKPLDEWGLTVKGEKLNAGIVMKLSFGGKSVLFCGDAVGRGLDGPEDSLLATEKYLLANAATLLPSNIIIAPHHGARNGSAKAFVEAVQPEYVVFSAGHKFFHPTTRTANQYLRFTQASKMLRTDRGDDEGIGEWSNSRIQGCTDKYNDDTIQIQLRSNGTYRVYYLISNNSCN